MELRIGDEFTFPISLTKSFIQSEVALLSDLEKKKKYRIRVRKFERVTSEFGCAGLIRHFVTEFRISFIKRV